MLAQRLKEEQRQEIAARRQSGSACVICLRCRRIDCRRPLRMQIEQEKPRARIRIDEIRYGGRTCASSTWGGLDQSGFAALGDGGITCHAAIVSREMGKPCIIGTKIATRVLKDGDMVEVDADKGIVRKI